MSLLKRAIANAINKMIQDSHKALCIQEPDSIVNEIAKLPAPSSEGQQ